MRPACFNARTSTASTGSFSRSDRRISAVRPAPSDLNPRLCRRRCSGIWPPSKPTLWKPPERDFWPLWPRPEVLPRPEPMPRPTRRRAFLAPAAGLVLFSFMSSFSRASEPLHQVRDLVDHPAHGRRVLERRLAVGLAQAEAAHGRAVRLARARDAADELHGDGLAVLRRALLRGGLVVHRAVLGTGAQPVISSTVRPRLAAISAGVAQCFRPLSVARTML